jgi:hypothetical protein
VSLEAAIEPVRSSFLPPERFVSAHQLLYQTSSTVASSFLNFSLPIDPPALLFAIGRLPKIIKRGRTAQADP